MEKLTNRRSFEYDARSLLEDPPPPAGQLSMVISGMTGANWGDLGDGIHALEATQELLNASSHKWTFDNGSDNKLLLSAYPGGPSSILTLSYGSSFYFLSTLTTGVKTTTPSIQDRLLAGSAVLNGVTFTWSKGEDWSRGNMNPVPAYDYLVSGAGTTIYNGQYAEEGTYNTRPYYKHESENRWLFYSTLFNAWALDDIAPSASGDVDYFVGSTASLPPLTGWSIANGTSPAPTLSTP